MNYRTVEVHSEETFLSNATKVIDINIKQPISNFILKYRALNVGDTITAHAMACLTKIEIVDGSEVLFSLDGYQAQALDWYDRGGKMRYGWNNCLTANTWISYVGINFGRFLYDPHFAFDPSRFTNPQIRISIEPNSGGSNCTYGYFTLYANVFDEKIPDIRGFLMSKEIKQYTMSSGTHEYTDMPTDYPYRGIYVRTYLLGTEPLACLNNFKLSEDQDSKIPFDISSQEIAANLYDYPSVIEDYLAPVGTGASNYLYIAPSNLVMAYANEWNTTANDRSFALYNGDGGRLNMRVNTGGVNAQIHVVGDFPHSVVEIPCGVKNDPDDWYDVRGLGSLRADILSQGSAVASIFLQQLRAY